MKKYNKKAVPVRSASKINLNELRRLEESKWSAVTSFTDVPRVKVIFDTLTEQLVAEINKAHHVIGCTAWLTNDRVLTALACKQSVSFVVQNDDLGYRAGARGGGRFGTSQEFKRWSNKLQRRYAALKGFYIDVGRSGEEQNGCGGPIAQHLVSDTFWSRVRPQRATKRCSNVERAWLQEVLQEDTPSSRKRLEEGRLVVVDSVRALGVRSTQQQSHVARMHHKFFVFLDADGAPYAVWTGSYNPTGFAEESLENAVLIESPVVASAYMAEYAQVLLQSVPLSWMGTNGWGCGTPAFVIE